jgi:hypothetical protein
MGGRTHFCGFRLKEQIKKLKAGEISADELEL